MNYSRFKRRYILMEEPNSAFSTGSAIKGLSKFETGGNKGFLRIGIQNLADKKDIAYSVLLAGDKNGQLFTVKMGTLIADNPGNYSYLGSFNPCDVDGKCHELQDFHSIIIIADSLDGQKTLVIRGHLHSKPYPISHEMLNPDPFSDHLKIYCRKMQQNINSYEKTSPFGDDFSQYVWWKIQDASQFPFHEPDKYHEYCSLISKYSHYLFGSSPFLSGDTPHFWLIGFPGKRTEITVPMDQFIWKPLRDVPEPSDGYGYHVCAVSASTGKLLSPSVI